MSNLLSRTDHEIDKFVQMPSSSTAIHIKDLNTSQRIDYDLNGNILFMGESSTGALEIDSVWRIKKFVYDLNSNLISVLTSGGKPVYIFDWTNRTTHPYS